MEDRHPMVLQGPLTELQNLRMALPSPPMVPQNPLTVLQNPLTVLQSLLTELPSRHMELQSRHMVGVVQVVPVGMGMVPVELPVGMVR